METKIKPPVTPIFFAGVGGCGKTTTAKMLAATLGARLAPSRTRDSYASFKKKYPNYADVINTERETQRSTDFGMAALALQQHIMQEFEKYVMREIVAANAAGDTYVIFERTPWCHASYLRLTIENAEICKVKSFKHIHEVRQAHSCYVRMMRCFTERSFEQSYYAAYDSLKLMVPAGKQWFFQIEDAIVVHLNTNDAALQRIAEFGGDGMRDVSIRKNAMMRQYLIRMLNDPLAAYSYCIRTMEYAAFSEPADELTAIIAMDICNENS